MSCARGLKPLHKRMIGRPGAQLKSVPFGRGDRVFASVCAAPTKCHAAHTVSDPYSTCLSRGMVCSTEIWTWRPLERRLSRDLCTQRRSSVATLRRSPRPQDAGSRATCGRIFMAGAQTTNSRACRCHMEQVGVGVFEHGRDQGQGLAGRGDAGRGSESLGWWAWRGAVDVEMAAAHRSRAVVPGIVLERGLALDQIVGSPVELDRDGRR